MQCQQDEPPPPEGQAFKVVDFKKEHRFGIVAADLRDLIAKASAKLCIPSSCPVKVVLEQDGTEVEDDDYFCTLEKNTALMILANDQKWAPPGKCPK